MGKRKMAKKKSKQPLKNTSEILIDPIATAKQSIDDAAQGLGAQTAKPPEPSLNQVLQNLAEALQNSSSQPAPRKPLAWIGDQLDVIRTILTNLIILALVVVLIFIIYQELKTDVLGAEIGILTIGKSKIVKNSSEQTSQDSSGAQRELIAITKRAIEDTAQVEETQDKKPQESSQNQALQSHAEALRNSRSQPEHRKDLAWFSGQLSLLRTVLTNLIILALGLLFIFIIYQEFRKDTVLIEPFEVPEELQKKRPYRSCSRK